MRTTTALEGNIGDYFSKKFYMQTTAQSNELNLKKISDIRKAHLGINSTQATYDSSSLLLTKRRSASASE